MDILISKENVESILTSVIHDMYLKIDAMDLSDTDKTKLQILNYIVTNGDGTKFLTDNGTYQTYDLNSIADANEKISIIYDIFNISGSTYALDLPADIQSKVDILKSSGDGSNVLVDNGTYVNLNGLILQTLTVDEVNTIITDVKALL